MNIDLAFTAFATGVLLLGGFVKGVIGLGMPAVVVGLLGLIIAPTQAAALLVVPNLVTNIWQVAGGRSLAMLLRRLWPTLLGITVGTLAGTPLVSAQGSRLAAALLGASLAVYALIGLMSLQWRVRAQREHAIGAVIGVLTGLATVSTGVFLLPVVPFLAAMGLDKEDLVQALGLSFLVSTITLAVALALAGVFQIGTAGASALALVPALLGMKLGQLVRHRISPATFRRCLLCGLLLLGLYLVARGIA